VQEAISGLGECKRPCEISEGLPGVGPRFWGGTGKTMSRFRVWNVDGLSVLSSPIDPGIMGTMRAPLRVVLLLGVVLLTGGQVAKAESAPAKSLADGAEEPPRPPHPEPRVIVNVLSVRGPHNPARVQHDARFGWKRIVRCYKASGSKEKIALTLELTLSSEGSVTGARGILFESQDSELVGCLIRGLPGLAMPKAPADSKADVELLLSPGDRPPKDAQVRY
jgi:hypothetical protein